MNDIVLAVTILSCIGFILGLVLAVAHTFLHVDEDPRILKIYDLLPHYDCGACGTAGCMEMAGKLVSNEIKVQKCRPAKPEQLEMINLELKNMEILMED